MTFLAAWAYLYSFGSGFTGKHLCETIFIWTSGSKEGAILWFYSYFSSRDYFVKCLF